MTATDPQELGFLTIPSSADHDATVIWIHGLGDSGLGMMPFAKTLSRYYACNHIKWVLPHAPNRLVTASKTSIPSWYDLFSFDIPNRPEDEEGLFAAVKQINNIVDAEIEAGIPPHRIVVGGFSQGAALSVLTGLTTDRKLGGIFVLSGYVPLRGKAKSICTSLFPSIPLFFTHGTTDRQVNYKFALEAVKTFATQLQIPFHFSESSFPPGVQECDLAGLRFHSYEDMGHEILETELEDLRLWIAAILPKQTNKSALETKNL